MFTLMKNVSLFPKFHLEKRENVKGLERGISLAESNSNERIAKPFPPPVFCTETWGNYSVQTVKE